MARGMDVKAIHIPGNDLDRQHRQLPGHRRYTSDSQHSTDGEDTWRPLEPNSPPGVRHITLKARSCICNAVVHPAVLYAAQVKLFPGSSADSIHRTWATFIWRSTYESMRKTNLFWSVDKGGLGLVNTKVKLAVHRFLFFRDKRLCRENCFSRSR